MVKKLLICSLMLLLFALSGTAFAAKTSSLENIDCSMQKTESGQDYLHVELSFNRPVKDFSASVNPENNKQLLIRFKDAKLANISRQENLDGTIGRKIFFQEMNDDYLQGKLYTQSELSNKSYKIYTAEQTKRSKKSIIAIDIFATAEAAHSTKIDGSVANVEGKVITLDAGHGGSDSGAIGPNGYMEKEATLDITQKVAAILTNSGADVQMTRDTDVDVYGVNASDRDELQARVNVANRADADIFISIHCNAFTNPAANGTQTFYYDGSYAGKRLAKLVQQEMVAANGLYDRGISTANFYVIKNSQMPAILIETAFITNPTEEALLSDSDWQTQLAQAIAQGISQYFS